MAPKAKNIKRDGDEDKQIVPSKEQDEIAKFLRFNCPTNTTIYQENEAHYFSGNKAVDTLLNSKYGNKAKGEAKFADRSACTYYIQELMDLGMFFRARKLVKKEKEKKKDKKDSDVSASEQDDKKDDVEDKKTDEKDKKKKKVKLEYHSSQRFLDDKDVYVWIFDPTPLWKKLVGLGMVLITVAGCCFPLWPTWMRQGVWYLSVAGLGAFGAILVTAILRTILYFAIWICTAGQHKLWILPNLTEDCGFLESFQPWYTYEYCPRNESKAETSTGDKKKEKKKKDKDSDVEDKKPAENKESETKTDESVSDEEAVSEENSASDSEVSQNSVPPSPESSTQPRKRRPRRADDGFVHVK